MRIAIIGDGFVASAHARNLRRHGVPLAVVCGDNLAKARAFAAAYGCAEAVTDLAAALGRADAAIIATPSPLHGEQARAALARGLAVLVELPACGSLLEAQELEAAAARAKVVLQCCHTSLYMKPNRLIGEWIRSGRLGEIRQVNYFRSVNLKPRDWIDDALWHHGGHPLDLLHRWFGPVSALACAPFPTPHLPQDVSLLVALPSGAPAAIALSYTARWLTSRMTVVGTRHTVNSDGYGTIESDDPALAWQGDGEATFDQAIGEQDLEFIRCCETGAGGIAWTETLRQLSALEALRTLRKGPLP
jgi:2-hydroxy-4-carboxymuconate semialdehyde hemiacetal dehydrogenase